MSEITERVQELAIKQSFGSEKIIPYAINPSRAEIYRMSNSYKTTGPQLRGSVFHDFVVIWPAMLAIHMDVAKALGREMEFSDTEEPGEHHFQIKVENKKIIFVGNPDPITRYFPRFTKVFDKIDLIGDDENPTEYRPSVWGLPAREGGWSSYLG